MSKRIVLGALRIIGLMIWPIIVNIITPTVQASFKQGQLILHEYSIHPQTIIASILICVGYLIFHFVSDWKMRKSFDKEIMYSVKNIIGSFISDGDLISDPNRVDIYAYKDGMKLHIFEEAWVALKTPLSTVIPLDALQSIPEDTSNKIVTGDDWNRNFGATVRRI